MCNTFNRNNFRDDVNQMDKLEILDLECREPMSVEVDRDFDDLMESIGEDLEEFESDEEETRFCDYCGHAVGASGCACDDYDDDDED